MLNPCKMLGDLYEGERENNIFSHKQTNLLPHKSFSWDKVNPMTIAYQEGSYFISKTSQVHIGSY
jgi:hypothetical protein